MAETVRAAVLAAIMQALRGVTALDTVSVTRDLAADEMIEDDRLPLLVVMTGQQSVLDEMTGCRVWSLSVSVEMYVGGDTVADAEDALDRLRAGVDAALLTDPSLGGVAWDLRPEPEPGISREMPQGARCRAVGVRSYSAIFATAPNDLTVAM